LLNKKKFIVKFAGERILEIGHHFAKFEAKVDWYLVSGHGVILHVVLHSFSSSDVNIAYPPLQVVLCCTLADINSMTQSFDVVLHL